MSRIESLANRSTRWIGSPVSLVFHTLLFAATFVAGFLGIDWDEILLVLTTAVSLEAIYLAIFIQMSVNRTTESLREVEADIDEIQEDVEEIQEDDEQDEQKIDKQSQALENIKAELTHLLQCLEKLSQMQNK